MLMISSKDYIDIRPLVNLFFIPLVFFLEPTSLSIEEKRLMQSLERLDERLKGKSHFSNCILLFGSHPLQLYQFGTFFNSN